MPSSAFAFLNKISAMAAKGASASVDDAVSGISVAVPASIDDPVVKGKSFAGLDQDRELTVFKNVLIKAIPTRVIVIAAAVGLDTLLPGALPYVLGAGGAFLAYEAGETVLEGAQHFINKKQSADSHSENPVPVNQTQDELQKEMEQGFTKTDIVMTSEVTGIALGSMKSHSVLGKIIGLGTTSVAVSAGVFGLVFGIIRADNVAMSWQAAEGDGWLARAKRKAGDNIMKVVPGALKGLSYVGTSAMFSIGGELVTEATPLEHLSEHIANGSVALSLAFATAVGLGTGLALAAAHKIPAVHATIETIGERLAPVFNTVSNAASSLKNKIGGFLHFRKKSQASVQFENVVEPIESITEDPVLDLSEYPKISPGSP